MKTVIRLTESNLHNIVKRVVNEALGHTIQLQLINGYFYPIDGLSKNILYDEYSLSRIPEAKFDVWSPKFVRDGYKLAVTDYNPQKREFNPPIGSPIGGESHPTKDPCPKCGFKGMCDKDECGKKNFRLFKK
jgi:hypothetical protein